jgi:hypothetical protein
MGRAPAHPTWLTIVGCRRAHRCELRVPGCQRVNLRTKLSAAMETDYSSRGRAFTGHGAALPGVVTIRPSSRSAARPLRTVVLAMPYSWGITMMLGTIAQGSSPDRIYRILKHQRVLAGQE